MAFICQVKQAFSLDVNKRKVYGKWKAFIMISLHKQPRKFNKIKQLLGISPNVLSQNLRELQQNAIVIKSDEELAEYSLTENGKKLTELILEIAAIVEKLP